MYSVMTFRLSFILFHNVYEMALFFFLPDETKLGHKLLERMGWEKGKGLGVNLHGNVDPIAVKKKDNVRGQCCCCHAL